ncbi:MAG: type II toxin-antitoxin system prevent-host-death family antitoxin [Actinomycetota bacterium]
MRTERSIPGVHIEVGVRQLREELSAWLDQVKAGDTIVVTERGRPIGRIVPVQGEPKLEQLIADGVITPARAPRRKIRPEDLIKAKGTVSDLVKEQRR